MHIALKQTQKELLLNYNNYKDVVIILNDDDSMKFNLHYASFQKGRFEVFAQKYWRTGEEGVNSQGYPMKIIEYVDATHVLVEFQDELKYKVVATYDGFKNGSITNVYGENLIIRQHREERLGQISNNNNGTKAVIVEYINSNKVLVEFQDEHNYRYYTTYTNFKNGQLTNPYDCRNQGGVGYIGEGECNSKDHHTAYTRWKHIIRRTVTDYNDAKVASYKDVTLCEEWMNFQNFAKWYYNYLSKYKRIPNDLPLCVDKDIKIHGNKIYSPDTCMIVPERINLMLIKEFARRGNSPIGTSFDKRLNKYSVTVHDCDSNEVGLGMFENAIDGFNAYKKAKEKYLLEMANRYKDILPDETYEAIINYRVDIND